MSIIRVLQFLKSTYYRYCAVIYEVYLYLLFTFLNRYDLVNVMYKRRTLQKQFEIEFIQVLWFERRSFMYVTGRKSPRV